MRGKYILHIALDEKPLSERVMQEIKKSFIKTLTLADGIQDTVPYSLNTPKIS